MATDWRTTIIAAAALLVALGVIWRYFVAPVALACWAAIVAAPQIANDLRDLPDLIVELRSLIADNIPGRLAVLEAEIVRLNGVVTNLTPALAGGSEEAPLEPFMLTDNQIAQRIHDSLNPVPRGDAG